jgi:hypothetical protein
MVKQTDDDQSLTPERCQEHAQVCRDMASRERQAGNRKHLENIAAAWEDLCEELKKRAGP